VLQEEALDHSSAFSLATVFWTPNAERGVAPEQLKPRLSKRFTNCIFPQAVKR
jgi:hypothetical protein